ncbi:cytochrome P450 [Mycena albidolilacea]|uniref:Cytochrome P450 n=1 Tax=Mycena albidolilacea TaxID=1033008 RepID=A0AAD7EBV9_9AGAR|nr:cytochrome P450 [Mycena albidolilacea]
MLQRLQTGSLYYFLLLPPLILLWNVLRKSKDTFPAIGSSGPLSSFIGAFQFLTQVRRMVHEGYIKRAGPIFRVPLFTHWTHIVSSPGHTREIGAARDADLSLDDAIDEIVQTDYTMGAALRTNTYHVGVVRGPLTRNLTRRFGDVRDEIMCAFEDVLSLKGTEWNGVTAYSAMLDVVCRTSNRLFVGLPLCRSPEWIDLNIWYTIDTAVAGQLIRILPTILRPIFGPLLTSRKRNLRQAEKLLEPILQERLNDHDSSSSNNDLISWLLDASPPDGRTVTAIAERILAINFGAIHTSSMSFTNVLFDLATCPQYMAPLREEVKRVVTTDGLTKAAIGKMYQVDSFLRESQRMNGIGIFVMPRRVANPAGFCFADGTVLPHGTFVEVAAMERHHDPALYDAPDKFDGFRFSRLREEQRGAGSIFMHNVVTTSQDFLAFGHGRHACPRRFFAAMELKAMLAHVILNYDVKFESPATRPPNHRYFISSS